MNVFNSIIIYLLFLILSDIKAMNNSPNKENKIRFLEDISKKNTILISIEAIRKGNYEYISSIFFDNYKPIELYLNNINISFNSSEIYLESGNHTIEIVFGDQTITNCYYMFGSCNNLQSLDLSNFDTSQVTDMSYMFFGCYVLQSLDLSNFNTSQVIDMSYMFFYCYVLQSLDLSNFNTSQVTDMSYMFSQCISLQSLDLSNFNTSQVKSMKEMFSLCSSLQSLNLSNFNTSLVIDFSVMFYGCSSLQSLDLSNFDTSQVADISYMFFGMYYLKSLDLSNFITSKTEKYDKMFLNTYSLEFINLFNYYGKDIFQNLNYNYLKICIKNYSQIEDKSNTLKQYNVRINCNMIYYCHCVPVNLKFGIEAVHVGYREIIPLKKEVGDSCVWYSFISVDDLSNFRIINYIWIQNLVLYLTISKYMTYDTKQLDNFTNIMNQLQFQNQCNLKRLDETNNYLVLDVNKKI